MSECFPVFDVMPSKLLSMKPLLDYLKNYETVYFHLDDSSKNEDMACEVLPNQVIKIKKLNNEDISKIMGNLKIECTCIDVANTILKVCKNHRDLLVLSEVISHGISYFDANERIDLIVENIECLIEIAVHSSNEDLLKSKKVVEIMLENFKLEYLISLIINNFNRFLIFIPTQYGRSVISCFIFVTLLHSENPSLINQICFALPDEKCIETDMIISTQDWFNENRLNCISDKMLNMGFNEKKSCFLILNDSDLFCAVNDYLYSFGTGYSGYVQANLCLVQENIAAKFFTILKSQIEKLESFDVLDACRKVSLIPTNSVEINYVLNFLKGDKKLVILSSQESSPDFEKFHQPFIVYGIQPQHEMFRDPLANRLCSFVLTFRTCEEGIMLANEIFPKKGCLHLWTENISQCFELKSRLNYEEICVNMIEKPLSVLSAINNDVIVTNGSLFHITLELTPTSHMFSSNEITAALELLTSGNRENSRFIHRYKRVVEILAAINKCNLLTNDISIRIKNYIETNFKDSHTSYEIIGNVHKLSEFKPMGYVILFVSNDVSLENVLLTILLVWIFGNEVLVISPSRLIKLEESLSKLNRMKSLLFLNGTVNVSQMTHCPVDSFICLGDGLSFVDVNVKNIKFLLMQKSFNENDKVHEIVNQVLPFVRNWKHVFIKEGGVGTK